TIAASALSIITGPIGLTIAGVAGLISILRAAGVGWDDMRGAATMAMDRVRAAVAPAFESIRATVSGVLDELRQEWEVHRDRILGVVVPLWGYVRRVAETALRTLGAQLSSLLGFITGVVADATRAWGGLFSAFLAALSGDWSGAWDHLKGAFGAFVSQIVRLTRFMAEQVLLVLARMVSAIPGVGDRLARGIEGAREKVGGVADGLLARFGAGARATGREAGESFVAGFMAGAGDGEQDRPSGATSPTRTNLLVDVSAEASDPLREALAGIGQELTLIEAKAQLFLAPLEAARARVSAIEQGLSQALAAGLSPASDQARRLAGWLRDAERHAETLQSALDGIKLPNLELARAEAEQSTREFLDSLALDDAELAVPPTALSGLDQFLSSLAERRARLASLMDDFKRTITDGLTSALTGLAEGFGQMAAGTASLGDVAKNLFRTVGSVMQKLGGLLIAFGTAGLLFQASGGFLSFLTNPAAAIGAGALLAAAGAAITGLLGNGGGSGSSSGYRVSQPYYESDQATTAGSQALDLTSTNRRLDDVAAGIAALRGDVRGMADRPLVIGDRQARRAQIAADQEARRKQGAQ
ncbi:MAG: hypothetical protein AAFQ53_14955, partial [Bacteroidota bacterium]